MLHGELLLARAKRLLALAQCHSLLIGQCGAAGEKYPCDDGKHDLGTHARQATPPRGPGKPPRVIFALVRSAKPASDFRNWPGPGRN